MTRKFLPPYNFVPVAQGTVGPTVPWKRLEKHDSPDGVPSPVPDELRHDRWSEGRRSGRIVCRLTTRTPTVVGSQQTKHRESPTTVKPFEIEGRPAIPGTTLKGLIASLAEAASNSTLRVLADVWPAGNGFPLWPGKLGPATPHALFGAVNPNLVPLSKKREDITIAEGMFGFVEVGTKAPRACAGRVLVSSALEDPKHPVQIAANPVRLRTLASPKAPSPSFYFLEDGKAVFIDRVKVKPGKHAPRGRKMYFHHNVAEKDRPWVSTADSKRDENRMSVRPIERGQSLYFHVDFDNLSPEELDLLCFALKPWPEFLHKLGLGKSLGLGSIEIDLLGLFFVDRSERYRTWAPAKGRYSQVEVATGARLPKRYHREEEAASTPGASGADVHAERHLAKLESAHPQILEAIRMFGRRPDPESPDFLVNSPLARKQHDREKDTFRWFADMYRTGGQFLPPLKGQAWPVVEENDGRAKQPPGQPGKAPPPTEGAAGSKIFVEGLSTRVTKADISGLFSQHASVVSVSLPLDRTTRQPRGFAFVEFVSPEMAAHVAGLPHSLNGRRLQVKVAR